MSDLTKQDVEKILYELNRIGQAVEFMAVKAGLFEFRPIDGAIKQVQADLQKQERERSRKTPVPPAPKTL